MALPLLLAGPILRRVEPTLATVWLALSQDAQVTLSVWEGVLPPGTTPPFVTGSVATTRIGDRLHLGLVTARIPETSGKSFLPNALYSYDVTIEAGGTAHTLQSLHMLRDASAEESPDGIAHVALGYEPDRLPSFALPPTQLTDLRILYGSCRKPGHRDPDAMVWIDDDVAAHVDDPRARPHQLFLGGDQIYADDVDVLFMLRLMDLGIELIGTGAGGGPVEHVHLDRIMRRKPAGPAPTQQDPLAGYELEDASTTAADPTLPIDKACFPPGRRLELTKRAAQFTSSDGSSHLISLGEFAAAYLLVWSNACWTDAIPGATFIPQGDDPADAQPLQWSTPVTAITPASTINVPPLTFPGRVPQHLFQPPKEVSEKQAVKEASKRQKSLRASHRAHARFLAGLPQVQRALANIPTYMILDDHDVTDDFFLNPMWRDRVLTTALGQTILTNAMLAYALFQDWGNEPRRYDAGPPAELLLEARNMFPVGAGAGPFEAVLRRLATLFGHDLPPDEPGPDGRYPGLTPPIAWHFSVDGPAHRVVALDNRTRRSYVSQLGPPGNVSIDAQLDQIPAPPLPAGRQVLVLVAPLQVIGPPVLDDLVAPLSYRVFDLVGAIKDEDTSTKSLTGLRQMTGVNPDAIEAWAFDAVTLEHLLERLAAYERVVILSGDVHNSSGSAMSYWRGTARRPARIIQFTSSGLKNVMPPMVAAVDRSAGFAQQMIRANLGTERIGWDRPLDDLVLLPDGRTLADLVPGMRSRLVSTPVMIPTWGWPDDNVPSKPFDVAKTSRLNDDAPPDWRWRITPLLDRRPDIQRPESIQPLAIDDDEIDADLADPDTVVDAYQAIAARHQHSLGHLRSSRQILFRSNYGVCRFDELPDGRLAAVHEVVTAFADPDALVPVEPEPDVYLFQRAPLDPDADDLPPTRLRELAIEVPRG